jgi:hypothetical protein
MIPINLVLFHLRLTFDIKVKETFLPDIRLENIDFEKILSVRTQRNNTRQTDPGRSGRGRRSGSSDF